MIRFLERLFHRHDWGDILLIPEWGWLERCSKCDDVRGVIPDADWENLGAKYTTFPRPAAPETFGE